ncbi:MAG TPA: hypothetical protein VNL14_16460 [Candidatus Acidoferrales bacterium]|nr:hypothetical protein [Candidatus Acidoferrales bacterium]
MIYRTRSYEAGLDGARHLTSLTEDLRAELGRHYVRRRIRLGLLTLTCLDRLDRLAEYLDEWDRLRQLDLGIRFKKRPRVGGFILNDDPLTVHFLYLQRHRKNVIEKKIARWVMTGRISAKHASRDELGHEELERRCREVVG